MFLKEIATNPPDRFDKFKTSGHILNTAANLLGFCLFVITSLHITDRSKTSKMDEAASVIAVMLIAACVFSFMSLRSRGIKRKYIMELIADYLFLAALVGVGVIVVFVACFIA